MTRTTLAFPDDEPERPGEIVKLDLSAGSIHTVMHDGKPHVILKPAIEELGLDFRTQLRKLKTRSWAVVGDRPTTGADGKTYEMKVVPQRTFIMLLATINENNIDEAKRPVLVAFQGETADAIEAYWTKGGAINERATNAQLETLAEEIELRRIRRCVGLVQLIAAMDDTVDAKWKRSRQLHHYAEAAGEIAEIPLQDRALMIEPYLKDKGLAGADIKALRSPFGRRVSLAFEMQYGEKPKDSVGLVDGRERSVKSYTEADRPLMDRVWDEFYADKYPSREDGAA